MSNTDPNYHALLSPSGTYKWLACAGSLAMEQGEPDESSEFADEGTAAHELAAMCLTDERDALAYKGRRIAVGHRTFEVDDDMAGYVQVYVDGVRARVEEFKLRGAISVELHVEQRVPIGHITGEEGAEGTSDAVIIAEWPDHTATCSVIDLKYGRGVQVYAEDNPQLQMYALGAVEKFGLLYDFKDVRVAVSQPRLADEFSEWECTIGDLRTFGEHAADRARTARIALQFRDNWIKGPDLSYLTPGEHCRKAFCKARATCPKLAQFVTDSVGADFDEIVEMAEPKALYEGGDEVSEELGVEYPPADLATKMQAVDLIEDWCKAVRAKVERVLLDGGEVPGFKLVQGRAGARAWSDKDQAEAMLKSMRLKSEDMYDYKLISPTSAEKLLAKESPKRWAKLQALISRSEGKPSVAPASDKRPALVIAPVVEDFEVVEDLV